MKALYLMLALLAADGVHAEAVVLKPFQPGSIQHIVEARDGRPFILTFWSLDCTHCRAELEQLAGLAKRHPQLDVVLVSTDTPAASADIRAALRRYGSPRAAQWVFADGFVERLRFEVDPGWHGELPRTYLYGPGKHREAITGRLEPDRLARWLGTNGYRSD